jgi:hypothetical protein
MGPSADERRRLDGDGFVVLEGAAPADLLAELRARLEQLFAEEGESAGAEFKQEPGCRRLANLADKGEVFHRALSQPWALEHVRHVLGPAIKLSSLNARFVPPYGAGAQPLHADMAAVADERGPWVCNVLWMLDDFTPDNGAVRVVPGSHRWGALPQQALADPHADHPDQRLVTGQAGSVMIMNAHLWHAGTANRTARPRTALHAFFCRRDKPQQQFQQRLLRPEVQRSLSPELRHLLALDEPFEEQLSGAIGARSGFLK